jgi:hypothetical protein
MTLLTMIVKLHPTFIFIDIFYTCVKQRNKTAIVEYYPQIPYLKDHKYATALTHIKLHK